MSEDTGDSRAGYRAIRGDGRWADEPDVPLQDERQARVGDSREQAIAAAKYVFQSSGKWDDRYFLHAFELGLDVAHQAGHIFYADEYATAITELQDEIERLRAALKIIVMTAPDLGTRQRAESALGDGEEAPNGNH